mmetsp:Transcript_115496/g.172571  ORF Transcript_115496/g.172571 Transcript_115496/m.172571 type:complete len:208 (-) Transcript_115496:319-942(-)
MSDARNSSGNIRGGGAKQTGGGGRTSKSVQNGGKNGTVLSDLEAPKLNARSEAKRNLQMQVMSKQLANSVRAALMNDHTEAEYEEFNIPMPDPATALKKLKAMTELTKNWYDKEFREEWLQKVNELWQNELREQYEAAFAAAERVNRSANTDNTEGMSIEELEAKIQSLEVGSEERTRLKKKLVNKKKKQKAKKAKAAAAASVDDLD